MWGLVLFPLAHPQIHTHSAPIHCHSHIIIASHTFCHSESNTQTTHTLYSNCISAAPAECEYKYLMGSVSVPNGCRDPLPPFQSRVLRAGVKKTSRTDHKSLLWINEEQLYTQTHTTHTDGLTHIFYPTLP